eukprot:935037-Prymnesium_polylepis.1
MAFGRGSKVRSGQYFQTWHGPNPNHFDSSSAGGAQQVTHVHHNLHDHAAYGRHARRPCRNHGQHDACEGPPPAAVPQNEGGGRGRGEKHFAEQGQQRGQEE